MHSLDVTRFGQTERLDVPADEVITFPEGLVGLEHLRLFALVDDPRVDPCRWLQSLDEPELAFVVVDPRVVEPSYEPNAPAGDLWAIITLRRAPERSTVNLLAPIVIDPQGRVGHQVVLHASGYALRHPISSPPAPHAAAGGDEMGWRNA